MQADSPPLSNPESETLFSVRLSTLHRWVLPAALFSFASSLFYWQMHYAIMRFTLFHGILPWFLAKRLAMGLVLACPSLCILLVVAFRDQDGSKTQQRLSIAALLVSLLSLPVLLFVLFACDPSWGTRAHQYALSRARGMAGTYANLHNERNFSAPDSLLPEDFFFTADDFDVNSHDSMASRLIVAYSRRTFPDTGVVLQQLDDRRYVYFGQSRAVAYADGHAELILTAQFPTVFAEHNAAREELGLPPQIIDVPAQTPTVEAAQQALAEMLSKSTAPGIQAYLDALSMMPAIDEGKPDHPETYLVCFGPHAEWRISLRILKWRIVPVDEFSHSYFGDFQESWNGNWKATNVGWGQRTK